MRASIVMLHGVKAAPPPGPEPLQDALRPEDFGAIAGNSATSVAIANETAFQNLLNAASANGKSIEFEHNRTYYVGHGTKYYPQLVLSFHHDFVIRGNGSKLIRGNGVVLAATNIGKSLINFDRCERFAIYDLIVDGNRSNVAAPNEYGYAFEFQGSRDVWLENCQGNNSQGDGFLLIRHFGEISNSEERNCKNFTLKNCKADNNNRQGITVANCNGVDVLGGSYTNTHGTAPGAGIDLEPDPVGIVNACTDVRIIGVLLENNQGSGIKMANRMSLDPDQLGLIKRVTVKNCVFRNNAWGFSGGSTVPISQMSFGTYGGEVTNNVFEDLVGRTGVDAHTAVWSLRRPLTDCLIAHNIVKNAPAANSVLYTWHVDQLSLSDRWLDSVVVRDNEIDVRTGMNGGGTAQTSVPQIARLRCSGVDFINNTVIKTAGIQGVVCSDYCGYYEDPQTYGNTFTDV